MLIMENRLFGAAVHSSLTGAKPLAYSSPSRDFVNLRSLIHVISFASGLGGSATAETKCLYKRT
jgi:hypothetical protein